MRAGARAAASPVGRHCGDAAAARAATSQEAAAGGCRPTCRPEPGGIPDALSRDESAPADAAPPEMRAVRTRRRGGRRAEEPAEEPAPERWRRGRSLPRWRCSTPSPGAATAAGASRASGAGRGARAGRATPPREAPGRPAEARAARATGPGARRRERPQGERPQGGKPRGDRPREDKGDRGDRGGKGKGPKGKRPPREERAPRAFERPPQRNDRIDPDNPVRRRCSWVSSTKELSRGGAAPDPIRLDKWLWQARFFKSRGLAAEMVERGKVRVNARASTKPRPPSGAGDVLTLGAGRTGCASCGSWALPGRRGPATEAQALYERVAGARCQFRLTLLARRPDP